MARRRTAWVLSLMLMAAGAVVAHALAYRLVPPAHHMHGSMEAETAHGYILHLDVCLAVCGAIALLALAASLVTRLRHGYALRAPVWVFALVPPVGFVIQEHLEHLLATGSLPYAAALDPTFLVGLALQLPFALAALLAVRALLALAVALVDALSAPAKPRLVSLVLRSPAVPASLRPCASALALGHGQRAPPSLAL